jgi:predicted ribosomally synthesized peptide with nif11-like leader
MTQQDVSRFFQALETDPALQAEAGAIDATDPASAAEGLAALGADHGYSFSVADLAAFLREQPASGELGEEELERVAGGLLLPAVQKVRDAAAR